MGTTTTLEDDWIGQRGALEGVKFGAHLLLFGCLCAVGAYNAAAYSATRERAHLANALLYGGLALYETRQLWRHATAGGSRWVRNGV